MPRVGDKIRITYMVGEPQYKGKEGTITEIDSIGQMHGTWGGIAVHPGYGDKYEILQSAE